MTHALYNLTSVDSKIIPHLFLH